MDHEDAPQRPKSYFIIHSPISLRSLKTPAITTNSLLIQLLLSCAEESIILMSS